MALLCGCADLGKYTWADDVPQSATADAYVIAPGDMLNIRVFNQEAMSGRGRVRSDGKLSLPFLRDVVCAGYTPERLSVQLQERLKDYVKQPVVTVYVEETQPQTVAVLGEVAKPGSFPLNHGTGVLQALAVAGGVTPYGHNDRIFVLRQSPEGVQRIRFTFDALSRAVGKQAQFRLHDGDTVVVE